MPPGPHAGLAYQRALLATAVEDMLGQPCRLCHAPGTAVGLWYPTRKYSRLLGAPGGTQRVLVYPLCAACAALPDISERVEADAIAVARRTATQKGIDPCPAP